MGNRRTLMAAAAIVLALAAGLGVYFYTSGADERAADDVAVVEAFVAVDVIPKGTSADAALSAGLIEPARVLRGSVPPSAVTDTGTLSGRVAASDDRRRSSSSPTRASSRRRRVAVDRWPPPSAARTSWP